MATKKKKAPPKPRYEWSRSPVEKPHSTKKGKKGYDRKQTQKDVDERVEEKE